MVGREWHVKFQMGCVTPVVVITAKEFNRMMDGLLESDDVSQSVLDKMAEVCRRNYRKGRVARKLRQDTIQMLKDGYCNFFGRDWETICRKNRHATYIETRLHIYGHLSSINYTPPEIAAFFIDRDRTTIIDAITRWRNLCEVDKSFAFQSNLLGTHMQSWMFRTTDNEPDTHQPLLLNGSNVEDKTILHSIETVDGGEI
jgi:hypothetical protein